MTGRGIPGGTGGATGRRSRPATGASPGASASCNSTVGFARLKGRLSRSARRVISARNSSSSWKRIGV